MITPLPFGGGEGGGAIIFLTLCVLFLCVLCEKKYVILYLSLCHSVLQKSPVSPRHSVILSSKKHLSLFVIMSLCLQKNICLPPSLCYSVFKKHLSLFVIISLCLQKKHLSPFVIMSLCLQKSICFSPSLCYSVFKKTSVSLCHYVIMSSKKHLSPFVIMSLCLQKTSVSLRHSVILSSKKHLSPFVIMSLCLRKNICLLPSLCYSVFKKKICLPLSLCHYVFKKTSVSLSVPLLFCLKTPQLGTEAGPAVVDVISFLSVLYQYFISCATSSPTTFLQYILFDKVVEVTCCGIL